MKKLKFAFAGLAIFTAVTTMSFTMNESKAKTADPGDDCWSIQSQVGNPLTLDRNKATDCPGNVGQCCFDQAGTYGFASL